MGRVGVGEGGGGKDAAVRRDGIPRPRTIEGMARKWGSFLAFYSTVEFLLLSQSGNDKP